jgi:hypothetical protein
MKIKNLEKIDDIYESSFYDYFQINISSITSNSYF